MKKQFDTFGQKEFISFFLILLLCFAVLFAFSGHNYSSDGYVIDAAFSQTKNLTDNAKWHVQSYRFTAALIVYLCGVLKHNPISNSTPDIIFFCFILAICITLLSSNTLNKNDDLLNAFLTRTAVALTFFNVGFCDVLSFPEMIMTMAVGTLFVTISIIASTSKLSVIGFLVSILFLVFATGCVQQFLPIYFIYAVMSLLHKNINSGADDNFVKELLYIFSVFFISGIVYFLASKVLISYMGLFGNERADLSVMSIIKKFFYFLRYGHVYVINLEYFKTYVHFFLSAALGGILLISLLFYHGKKRERFLVILMSGISYICAFLPAILSTSTNVRAMLAVSSLYFILVEAILVTHPSKLIKRIVLSILSLALLCNIYKIEECEINLKRTNAIDKTYAEAIIGYINQYEIKSGNTVTEISFCQDDNCKSKYYDYSFTNRAFTISWSSDQILNVFKSADHPAFHISEMPDEKKHFFLGKDWEHICLEEQIIFDSDRAYICIF